MAGTSRRLTTDAQVRASVVKGVRRAARDQLRPAVAKLTTSVDRFIAASERLDGARRSARALDYLIHPDAETRAMRDRVAFLDGTRQQAEHQRQQLRDQQARADKFYGRGAK